MQLMEGKTFHPEPGSMRQNRFARWRNAVGCGLLAPWPCRQGIRCLVCTVVPARPGILGFFLLERWMRWHKEVMHSWILLSDRVEICSGC